MKYLKIFFLTVFSMLMLASCSKKNYPVNNLKKQLTGQWKLVSQGGGFGNLPETPTQDNIVVEFGPDDTYRRFTDNTLETETGYAVKHTTSAITGKKQYVIVLKEGAPYINFTVSDTELVLSGDHVDAMYFKYAKIKN